MSRRWRAALCALCLGAAIGLPAAAAGAYSDVQDGAWYAEAVAYVSERGYMTGTGPEIFSPDASVTRATVLTTLWRLEGSPAASVESPFPDVVPGSWYETAAAWAKGYGVAAGGDGGTLRPDAPVTRQELAVFLYRYAKYTGGDLAEGTLSLYDDYKMTSLWAVDGMKHAVGLGLLQGSEGELNPGGVASRAQLAVILRRLTTPAMG